MQELVHFLISPPWVRVFALGFLCLISADITAQVDTLELEGVEIAAQQFSRNAGVRIEQHPSADAFFSPGQSVEGWLSSRSNMVMRGYGPGSSYGISLRGGSASQTQIMLNGIPFEHPGLAQADISLLPAVLFTNASVYRGSSGALLGNASVGGTLFFDTNPEAESPLFSQMFSVGSFGSLSSATVSSYRHKRFSGRTALYWQESKNDFDRPDPLNPEQVQPQPDADFMTRGLEQSLAFSNKNGTSINGSVWYNETERDLPPTLSQTRSQASQKDKNLRIQAGADRRMGAWIVDAKAAYDYGLLDYRDANQGIDETSNFHTVHLESSVNWAMGAWEWTGMAIFRESSAIGPNFTRREVRSSPAVLLTGQYRYGKLGSKISAATRGEWLNGNFLPMLPTIGITHCVDHKLEVRASAGRVYRLPGLNDLYWSPGGNPELLPESGWSGEAGFDLSGAMGKSVWKFSATGFNREVRNWIVWIPQSGLWSPENLKRVWSRGLELNGTVEQVAGEFKFIHMAELGYVQSTHQGAASKPSPSDGKQLIYVPVWSNFFSETIQYRQWNLMAIVRHQSERFTNTDNTRNLDPFFIADLEIAYSRAFRRWDLAASVAIRNLFDQDYQLAANRPMPGRYFALGLQFAYKSTK
jgi:iron complex outermembrane receptor protein